MKTLNVGQCITSAGSEFAISVVHLEDGKITYSILGLNTFIQTEVLGTSIGNFSLCSRVLSLDELRDRRRLVQKEISQRHAQEIATNVALEAATAQIIANPANSSLIEVSNGSAAKTAVKNIRILLKRNFPGVKFSVRMPYYGSVCIAWEDGAPENAVIAVISCFKHGSFNGMNDCYEYNHSPFNDLYGGVSYISTSRKKSDALIAKAIEQLRIKEEQTLPDGVTVEAYKRGNLLFIKRDGFNESYQAAISEIIESMDETK